MTEPQLEIDAGATARRDHVPSSRVVRMDEPATSNQYALLQAKLAKAANELECGDTIGRSDYLEAASAIVFDLLYSLDFKRGGELVPRLAALYGYIGNELLDVSRTRDREQLEHLRDMVTTLLESC
ncbi:MAG: flagellar protein FliS [Gemmatimonadaceae bacterium]